MLSYVIRDLLRNPRRTMASVAGVALAVGLFSGIAFFVDSSASQMTARAIAPVAIDMQVGLTRPLAPATPVTSGDTPAPDLSKLRQLIAAVPGVATVEPFALLDLPAGRLSTSGRTLSPPFKVVAVDPSYFRAFPAIKATGGAPVPGSALLSQSAADLLAAAPGASVRLQLPGRDRPLELPVAGIADFSSPAGSQLFASRNPDNQGDLVAAPNVLVIDFNTFANQVIPALRADATAATPAVSTPPVVEMHVALTRGLLSSDPASAVVRTQALRRTLERIAPGEVKVIDNLSDTLVAAQKDSTLAKVLFLFLGLPGVLLAAYLSRYAGSLLAQAQRRERATLRARGMQPAQLMRALAYNTAAIAVIGAGLGLILGAGALTVLFSGSGRPVLSAQTYGWSVVASLVAALLTTVVALYLPARRALSGQVADERREVQTNVSPAWLRLRLDLVMLAAAALVGSITYLTGGYKPTPVEGQSISLSFYILLAPLFFWVGATLLLVRLMLISIERFTPRAGKGSRFRRGVLLPTLMLSVRRRPQAVASGVVALSLAVAFGASLAIFVNTYQAQKLSDARLVVGADVRATPALVPGPPGPTGRISAATLMTIPGVRSVASMDQATVVVGTEKRALAAVDAETFGGVARLSPAFFSGIAPDAAMKALAADPSAALIDTELARAFNIQTGDTIKLQMTDRASGRLVPATLHAVGVFKNFPGFPQGVDLVANRAFYERTSHTASPDTFLVRTDGSERGTASVATAVSALGTASHPLVVDTTAKAYNIDQSSLSSLNISGLGRLEGVYTVLLSAFGIAIFVFGLLLQRAKEHVTMRALGLRMVHLQGLVLGEAGLVAVVSLIIGGLVGTAMALMFVQILRPLFAVAPDGINVPVTELALLAALVMAAMALSSVVAGATLRRLRLVEILREE